jgi:hypothetical protein
VVLNKSIHFYLSAITLDFFKPPKTNIMKTLNLSLCLALLFSFVLVSSSFTNPANEKKNVATFDKRTTTNNGVGNVITIDNGDTWIWLADNCTAPEVNSTTTRIQYSSNGFFNIFTTFQLPAGHCDIPATGARVTRYNAESWAIVNSNGFVMAKIVYNPNGNN